MRTHYVVLGLLTQRRKGAQRGLGVDGLFTFVERLCTGVDDFYYRKNAFSIWKLTPTQGEYTFSFFATIFTFSQQELRKHTLIIC